MKNALSNILSFFSGVTNGLFGAGGGILAVEYFKRKGLSQKKSQATALCVTLSMSAISAVYYLRNNYFQITDAMPYISFGIPGAITGSFLLSRLSDSFSRKIFAVFVIIMAARMLIK